MCPAPDIGKKKLSDFRFMGEKKMDILFEYIAINNIASLGWQLSCELSEEDQDRTLSMEFYQFVFSFFLLSEALSIVDKRIINEKVKSDNHEGRKHIGGTYWCF